MICVHAEVERNIKAAVVEKHNYKYKTIGGKCLILIRHFPPCAYLR